jgi:hypothetical protein
MARTNKTLRRMIMSRSMRAVWIASINAVPGMPPCPAHLTVPQYVQLAFENNCHVSSRYAGVLWLLTSSDYSFAWRTPSPLLFGRYGCAAVNLALRERIRSAYAMGLKTHVLTLL